MLDASLSFGPILASIVYAVIGVVVMIGSVMAANSAFRLDLRRELLEEHNTAAATVIGALVIAIGVIVAAAIH